ncbi:hypothetical protein HanPSC8_Chr01g0010781 [Helianthus annuus]|nr:hypothetical protein HanPSC8_Chr01g0010781 [Helianthus annuus]
MRKGRGSIKRTSGWRTTFERPTLKVMLGILRMAVKQVLKNRTSFRSFRNI